MKVPEQLLTDASMTSGSTIIAGTALPAAIATAFAELTNQLHSAVGVAVTAVAPAPHPPMVLGDWNVGPAWSTIKVPLVMAALRQTTAPKLTSDMIKTIRDSDNAAAERIWDALGTADRWRGRSCDRLDRASTSALVGPQINRCCR